jgi:hypothetical protein
MQIVDPWNGAYIPLEHGVHIEPSLEKVPGGQGMHTFGPPMTYLYVVPGGHVPKE